MNLTVNRFHSPYQSFPTNNSCGYDGFSTPQPLGAPRSGIGRMLGGVVGAVLGQMMCPVPFLGAMLGGLIGSMFGSMLDNIFGSSAPCCCHNMGQQYGPYNQQMGMDYGYPMPAYPYPPQGFPNPDYGQWGPAFPPQAPPLMPWGLPRISSPDVAPGRSEEISVRNRPAGVRVDTEMHRGQDGTSVQVTDVQNRRNPDAALDTTTAVGPGGRIDTVSRPVEGGVQTDTLAQNGDGTAATRETTLAREDRTDVVLTDVDGAPGNMQVVANDDTVVVTNPGSPNGGPVQNQVDISEESSDGLFENLGRGVANLFGGEEEPRQPIAVNGADQVHVSRNEEGQATVTVGRDGQHHEVLTTAGDTDDSLIERAGEVVDDTISAVGNAVGDAAEAVGDVASRGWRTVRGWFS